MLDINTPKGQESLECEKYLIDRIKRKYQIEIIETNKEREARIDNLFIKDSKLIAIAEMKCRDMTEEQLKKWGDTWLVTHQKIKDGAEISKLLCVPFLGFLYLIPDDILLWWKITDDAGNYLFDFEVRNTVTQATINGGKAYRDNAFLPRMYSKAI